MSERFYFDHHVQDEIVDALMAFGVDCLRARDDGYRRAADDVLLQHATDLGGIMVSSDRDMICIASEWLKIGRPFAGLIVFPQLSTSPGRAIGDLRLIAEASFT